MLCISAFAQRLTVATVENGTITATPTTPAVGNIVTLAATPNANCEFVTWYIHKTGDPNTVTTVVANTFRMPNYDVTVSGVFATTENVEVSIGSGTSTNGEIPVNSNNRYTLTEQIYTSVEMGVAGTITQMSLYVSANAARRNIDIYLKPTRKSSFSSNTDWETMSDVYKVFSDNYTFVAGWNTITFTKPFEYDGSKNVILCVVDKTASTANSSMTFYTYSSASNRTLRVRNNNNPYTVGYSNTIQGYNGTRMSSNNQVKFVKTVKHTQSLNVDPDVITDFNYLYEQGPSAAKIIDVLGADLDNDITVTAPAGFEVSTSANGAYSESLTIPRASSKGGRGTTNWNFEGSFLNWTTIDKDGDGRNWMVSTNLMSSFNSGHSGSNALTSESYRKTGNNSGTPLNPDNWLISPQVTLGGTFSIWACAQDATWAEEHFGIFVSTTSNTDTDSFTMLNEWTIPAQGGRGRGERGTRAMSDWIQYSVDLTMYEGQTGYIAVRHFDTYDMFYLNVDDFTLDTEATYVPELPVTLTKATVYARMRGALDPDIYSGDLTLTSGSKNATVNLSGEVYGSGEQYTITTNVNPINAGTVTGGGTYYDGSIRTLTATPTHLYDFTRWEKDGNIVSIDNPYEITVTGDATYTAVFTEKVAYDITVNQTTGGTISADMDRACAGDVVTLSKTVAENYFFAGWRVQDATNNIIEVTNNQFVMPEHNVTVTASFRSSFTITITQTDHGTVNTIGDITEACPGQMVGLEAIPEEGYMLLTWYVYRTGNPRDVVATINNDNSFEMLPLDVSVMAVFVTVEEGEIGIGSGTNERDYLPTYTGAQYSLTQQIYTASELQNNKGRITKIAFRGANYDAAARKLLVYIRHTDKDSFSGTKDWDVMDPATTKMFEGDVDFTITDWTTITLDRPFEYDGIRNINICVVDDTGNTDYNSSWFGLNKEYLEFYQYNTGSNRSIYAYGSKSYTNAVGMSSSLTGSNGVTGTTTTYVDRINITMDIYGSAESISLTPRSMDAFSYVEGQGPSNVDRLDIVGIDLDDDLVVSAPVDYEISLSENGYYSSSITIPHETGNRGNRSVTNWGFEGSLEGWTAIDADGDGYNWILGSQCGGVYLAEGESITDGHDLSRDMIVSGSYTNAASTALTPDNWLISPQVTLGGSFSFWAQPYKVDYPADYFAVFVSTTGTNPEDFHVLQHWVLESAAWYHCSVDLRTYEGQQGYIAVRHYNCTDQFIVKLDDFELNTDGAISINLPVTITSATVYVRMQDNLTYGNYDGILHGISGRGANDTVSLHGVVMANYNVTVNPNSIEYGAVRGTGTFNAGSTVTVRAAAYEGYRFVNWTEDDVEVSTDETYSFVITANRDLIANFEQDMVTLTYTLYQGWNWWSTYLDITLDQLKSAIADALGANGIAKLQNKTGGINYRSGRWRGSGVQSFDITQMYMIYVSTDIEITLTSTQVDSDVIEITVHNGYNWIEFSLPEEISITAAFAELEPVEGDAVQSKSAGAVYRSGRWRGQLKNIEPGQGYIYKSQSLEDKVFKYHRSAK